MQHKNTGPTIQLNIISRKDLVIGPILGSGSYGIVSRATWYGTDVAIKEFHLKTLTSTLQEEFLHETKIMAQCQFPHIVSLYGICDEPGYKGLVMEYMKKGSLRAVLDDKTEVLSWERRLSISIGIGNALQYLHGNNILHRDLKSHNILLDENYHARVCDFGLSKIRLETTANTNKAGTIRWRAPETFKRGYIPDSPMDIFSYGMVLWELASRKLPFSDAPDEMTVMGWIKDGDKEIIPEDCPKDYGEIISATWLEAGKRPPADKIVEMLATIKPPSAISNSEIKPSSDTSKPAIKVEEKKPVIVSEPKKEEKQESAETQFKEGLKYYNGEGVKQNYKLAVEHFHLAADQEHTDAQFYIGICYANGLGVDKNNEIAVKYYHLAAKKGHPAANNELGYCCDTGQGVEQDFELAARCYKLAADKGHAEAQRNIGFCYANGQGVKKDEKQAAHYYQLSADQGDAKAQYNLSYCYEEGLGVKQDYKNAIKYCRLSADNGYAKAQYNLGICYEKGKGVSIDYKEAFKYYKLSAAQDNLYADRLGVCYERGLGVEQNMKLAAQHYQLSAAKGNSYAKEALQRISSLPEIQLEEKRKLESANSEFKQGLSLYLSIMDKRRFYGEAGRYICSAADLKSALTWFEIAANKGHAAAQYYFAKCHDNHINFTSNKELASKYYQLAGEKGRVDAINETDKMKIILEEEIKERKRMEEKKREEYSSSNTSFKRKEAVRIEIHPTQKEKSGKK